MEYSLYNLDKWYSNLIALKEKHDEAIGAHQFLKESLNSIRIKSNFLDTKEKIDRFMERVDVLEKSMRHKSENIKSIRLDLENHCKIIPLGPTFKVNHMTGTFKISRDVAHVEILIYSGRGHFKFDLKIRYLFDELNLYQIAC